MAFFAGAEALEDTTHSATLLSQLKSFYDARMLCDVTIEVVTPGSEPGTGRLFSCNRNVLAAACPYFKAMFSSDMYESQHARVTIHGSWSTTATLVACSLMRPMCNTCTWPQIGSNFFMYGNPVLPSWLAGLTYQLHGHPQVCRCF
ncbi:Kelch repeat and BTB domain-containing protein 7 [Lemmus lemmus]